MIKTYNNINRHFKAFLWAVILVGTNFFGFLSLVNKYINLYIGDLNFICLFMVGLTSLGFSLIRNKRIRFSKFYGFSCIFLFFLLVIEVLLSFLNYRYLGQSFIRTLKEAFYFFVSLVLYLAFIQYDLRPYGDTRLYFFESCEKACLFCTIIACVVFFMFQCFNINILSLDENIRNGSLRFSIGGFCLEFAGFYSFSLLINKKAKGKDVICFICFLIQTVFFMKTRMLILAYSIIGVGFILLSKKANSILSFFSWLILFFCFLFLILNLDSFLFYVSEYFNSDSGIMIRFKTISYFINQLKGHWIFGTGFISSSKDAETAFLLYGSQGYYYRDDVGIIGFMNEYGIMGILFFSSFFLQSYQLVKRRSSNDVYSMVCKSVLFYSILTLVSLFVFRTQAECYFFYYAMLFVISMSSKNQKNICGRICKKQ